MSKVYLQPKTKVYRISQQVSILTGSADENAHIKLGDRANTDYDVEVKKEADFFWN